MLSGFSVTLQAVFLNLINLKKENTGEAGEETSACSCCNVRDNRNYVVLHMFHSHV